MLTDAEMKRALEQAYRAVRGFYAAVASGESPNDAMLAYHSPTIGAAIRFVDDGELDAPDYFVGKPVTVLQETLAKAYTE